MARQPGPGPGTFAFLDPLLRCAQLVVKANHVLLVPVEIRDDNADFWKQFPVMPFDLAHDTARFRPTVNLIQKRFVQHLWLVSWTPQEIPASLPIKVDP